MTETDHGLDEVNELLSKFGDAVESKGATYAELVECERAAADRPPVSGERGRGGVTLAERLEAAVERLEALERERTSPTPVNAPSGSWMAVVKSVPVVRYDGTVKLHGPSYWGGFVLHDADDDCLVLSAEEWPREAAWERHVAEHDCNPICEEGSRLLAGAPWHVVVG